MTGLIKRIGAFFSGGEDKALVDVDSEVSVNSNRTAGKGQIGGIKNKNGSVTIDNSTNYYFLGSPDEMAPGTKQFDEVQKIFKQKFNNQEVQFLIKQSDQTIIGYNDFEQNSPYKETADFFEGKISDMDLQFLRTGLYIRYLSDNNRKDESLKVKDGAIRNNPRARNIINLASGGFFEDYVMPIHENNDEEIFDIEYEEVVNYLPEIIFVNNNMSVADIMTELEEKIARSKQYHIQVKCVMINGLNQSVEIIRAAEPQIRKKYPKYQINLQTDGSLETLLRGKLRIGLPSLD